MLAAAMSMTNATAASTIQSVRGTVGPSTAFTAMGTLPTPMAYGRFEPVTLMTYPQPAYAMAPARAF